MIHEQKQSKNLVSDFIEVLNQCRSYICLWQVKIGDPEFECVAEHVLESWQKGNQTYKKVSLLSSAVLAFACIWLSWIRIQ
jgi:hypothetical protein